MQWVPISFCILMLLVKCFQFCNLLNLHISLLSAVFIFTFLGYQYPQIHKFLNEFHFHTLRNYFKCAPSYLHQLTNFLVNFQSNLMAASIVLLAISSLSHSLLLRSSSASVQYISLSIKPPLTIFFYTKLIDGAERGSPWLSFPISKSYPHILTILLECLKVSSSNLTNFDWI